MQVNVVASVDTKHQVAMLLMAEMGVSFLPEAMAKEWSELVVISFEGMSDKRHLTSSSS